MQKSISFQWIQRYPVVFAAFFMLTFYIIATVNFVRQVRTTVPDIFDYVFQFGGLFLIGVFGFMFIKMMRLQEELHHETAISLERKQELDKRETQMRTLREVTLTFQDEINNPLAIISAHCTKLSRRLAGQGEIQEELKVIQESVKRITERLSHYYRMTEYNTVSSPVGNLLDTQRSSGPVHK
ncbi:MAG TPA: hypothetical protein VIH68_01845 [Bacteroidota bacterium]